MDASYNDTRPVRVVYIAGFGRSGSTVLDRLLGAQPGYVSLGELFKFWSHVAYANLLCGCGERFSNCTFWQRVREIDPWLFDSHRAERFYRVHERELQTKRMYRFATRRGRARVRAGLPREYREGITRLYRALSAASGAQVIVDSSKNPVYLHLLSSLRAIDVTVVHLVRDPRAVAHSWTRTLFDPNVAGTQPMFRKHPFETAMFWNVWNVVLDRYAHKHPDRCVRLRYEDLIASPAAALESITAVMGVAGDATVAVPQELAVGHMACGNPSRFVCGPVALVVDDAWRTELSHRRRRIVTAAASPFLARFGYRGRVTA